MPDPVNPVSVPVRVVVNFTGVTYDSSTQTWSGDPSWRFHPDKAHAFAGNNTISWALEASNGQGYTSAFPSEGAIVFKSTDDPQWGGGTPTTQNATSVTADDSFENQQTEVTYHYTTNVVLTAPGGTTTKTFTHDPAVQNDPGGILCHSVAAVV